MNEIKVFNEQTVLGKEFKVYGSVEQPLFLANDVSIWIEHSKTSMMLQSIDEDEKLKETLFTSGQNREMWFLTEDGLYEVLMQSRKPIAKEFKKEVKKILKQMRLTGGAVVEDREEEFIQNYFPSFSNEVKTAMVLDLRKQNQEMKLKLEEAKPMIAFAETVAASSDTIDMSEMAKLICKEGVKIGRNRLFDFLRDNSILRQNNEPYQKYIDNGWFEVEEITKKTPYGDKLFVKTMVTGKGQIKIVELVRGKYMKQSA